MQRAGSPGRLSARQSMPEAPRPETARGPRSLRAPNASDVRRGGDGCGAGPWTPAARLPTIGRIPVTDSRTLGCARAPNPARYGGVGCAVDRRLPLRRRHDAGARHVPLHRRGLTVHGAGRQGPGRLSSGPCDVPGLWTTRRASCRRCRRSGSRPPRPPVGPGRTPGRTRSRAPAPARAGRRSRPPPRGSEHRAPRRWP